MSAQPVSKPPSCSFLLRMLPPSSAYNSPCFPPPAHYVQAAQQASHGKLESYFKTNDFSHLLKLNKCVIKHMPQQDWSQMHKLTESAYQSAKTPKAPPSSNFSSSGGSGGPGGGTGWQV